MAIKLLKKDEIANAQNLDKAREISEGLKISRRVDSLRELQANEEAKLQLFRSESLAAIQKDIAVIDAKREMKMGELKALEEKAKQELSKTEKKRLEEWKKSLEAKDAEMKEKSYNLDLKELDIACTIKETTEALERQRTHEETAKMLHEQALQKSSEADQTLMTARRIQENVLLEKQQSESELNLKANSFLRREEAIKEQERENEKRARELNAEKIQLADQRATLERAMERLRQNRL